MSTLEQELADVNAKYLDIQEKYAQSEAKYAQSEARNKRTELLLQKVEQMEVTVLTCSICEETYSSLTSLRLLPCAHIFCLQCLSKWIKQAQDKHFETFDCPQCRRQHQVPKIPIEEEWPHPHFLSNFLKCVQMSRCSSCHQAGTQETASWVCSECQEIYCDHCRAEHDSLKTDHEVTLLSLPNATSSDEQLYCQEHKSKPVEAFCKDCDTMTCVYCILHKHRDHNFLGIPEAANEYREILGSKISEVSEGELQVKSYITKVLEALKVAKNTTKQILHDIDMRTEEIISDVKAHQKKLHLQVAHEENIFNENINAIHHQAKVHLTYLRNYKEKLAAARGTENLAIMLRFSAITKQELKPFNECDSRHLVFGVKYNFIGDTCDARRLLGDIVTDRESRQNGKFYSPSTESVTVETQMVAKLSSKVETEIQTEPGVCCQFYRNESDGSLLDRVENIQFAKRKSALKFQKVSTLTIPTLTISALTFLENGNIILGLYNCFNDESSLEIYDHMGKALNLSFGRFKSCSGNIAYREDRVYISDNSGRVNIFNIETCVLIETLHVGTKGVNRISITGDFMYITSCNENAVYRLDLNKANSFKKIFASYVMWSWFQKPMFVASDVNTVVVSCSEFHLVHVFSSDGSLRFTYSRDIVSGEGQLNNPQSICLDKKGNILIADIGNGRIVIVSRHGCLLGKISGVVKTNYCPVTTDFDGRLWFKSADGLHGYTYS